MNDLKIKQALSDISEQVENYRKYDNLDGATLIEMNRIIVGNLFYLEGLRSDVHDLFQTEIHNLTKDKVNTVARAENMAHVKYPQMYQLRRVMDGAYRVTEAIRTHVSYLKSEKQHSN